ncbi:MAG: hypothetical protein EP332_07485 [Bacteroidetes bacterium]|nr:MAG: hypothetical protein EP332_07485 [Bacteroidota bacterium]
MANKTQTQQSSAAPQSIEIDLINGTYNAAEGAEIVCHLLDEKIKFLSMRNFSDQVRFGELDEEISERLEYLKQAVQEARSFIQGKNKKNQSFTIESKITIRLNK